MIPDISIGQFSVVALLPIIMGLFYKFIPIINDRFKALTTIAVAVILSIISMFYSPPEAITFKVWVDTILAGIFIGASAVGLYEGQKTFRSKHRT